MINSKHSIGFPSIYISWWNIDQNSKVALEQHIIILHAIEVSDKGEILSKKRSMS